MVLLWIMLYLEQAICRSYKFAYNEILCTTNPLGIKGAGEAGAIGAPPAVINAVCNA